MGDIETMPATDVASAPVAERERMTVGKAAWAVKKLQAIRSKRQTMESEVRDAIRELEQFRADEGGRLAKDEEFFSHMLEGYYHQQNEGSSKKKPVHIPGGHVLTYSRGGLEYTYDKSVVLDALLEIPDEARPQGCVEFTEPVGPTALLRWASVKSQVSVLSDGSTILLVAVRDADGNFVNPHTGEVLPWALEDFNGEPMVVEKFTGVMIHPLLCWTPETQQVVMAVPGVVAAEKPREFTVNIADGASVSPTEGGEDEPPYGL